MREDRPSSTATLIAAATVFLAGDARVSDLVPSGAAEWCARCLEALSSLKTVETLSHPALRWAARLAERATVPGLLLHFMLRKRWIEEAVRSYQQSRDQDPEGRHGKLAAERLAIS